MANNEGYRPHKPACRVRFEEAYKEHGDERWQRALKRHADKVGETMKKRAAEPEEGNTESTEERRVVRKVEVESVMQEDVQPSEEMEEEEEEEVSYVATSMNDSEDW